MSAKESEDRWRAFAGHVWLGLMTLTLGVFIASLPARSRARLDALDEQLREDS